MTGVPIKQMKELEDQLSIIDAIDVDDGAPILKTEARDVVVDVQIEDRTEDDDDEEPNEQLVEVTRIEEDDQDLLDGSLVDDEGMHVDDVGNSSGVYGKNLKSIQYAQRYRNEWEHEDFCKEWISPYPQNEFMAWCRACNRNLFSRKNDLYKHNASQRHRENMEIYRRTGTPGDRSKKFKAAYKFNPKFLEHPSLRRWLRPVPNSPHRSWCCLCACFLAPQLNGLIMHSKSMKHRRNLQQKPTQPPTALVDGSLGSGQVLHRSTSVVTPLGGRMGGDDIRTPRRYHKRVRKPKRPWTPTEDDDESQPANVSMLDLEASESEAEECLSPPETDFSDRVTFSIGLGGRKVGFLGAGQMAQSMAQGMLDQGLLAPSDVTVSAPSGRHMAVWRRWKCDVAASNDQLVQQSDIIVLAVKANVLNKLVQKLQPVQDGKPRLFISVIPGVPRQRVLQILSTRISSCTSSPRAQSPVVVVSSESVDAESSVPTAADSKVDDSPKKQNTTEEGDVQEEPATVVSEEAAEETVDDVAVDSVHEECLHVVRCAPNKMMAIGVGFCAYCMGVDLPHALYLAVETIFSSLGTCVEVDESLMDAYSTAVGSGSAFTCAFIEALVQGTVSLDVPWDEALKASACVVLGTAKMLLQSGRQPAELRRSISTPNGSTLAGLAVLQRGGLDDNVVGAMEVACRKTADLGANV